MKTIEKKCQDLCDRWGGRIERNAIPKFIDELTEVARSGGAPYVASFMAFDVVRYDFLLSGSPRHPSFIVSVDIGSPITNNEKLLDKAHQPTFLDKALGWA